MNFFNENNIFDYSEQQEMQGMHQRRLQLDITSTRRANIVS